MTKRVFLVASVLALLMLTFAIALPNLIGAQGKSKTASIRGQMRTIQIALESYATDFGGAYPKNIHELRNALNGYSGGSVWIQGYYIGSTNTAPDGEQEPIKVVFSNIHDPKTFSKALTKSGVKTETQIIFCASGNGYCFAATDISGHAVPGIGGEPLILSNY